jgi:hypothetical protein
VKVIIAPTIIAARTGIIISDIPVCLTAIPAFKPIEVRINIVKKAPKESGISKSDLIIAAISPKIKNIIAGESMLSIAACKEIIIITPLEKALYKQKRPTLYQE